MPFKTWVVGEEVLAADFQSYLQNQVVATFPTTAARDAAIAAPIAGQLCVTTDTGTLWQWTGAAWRKPWGSGAGELGTAAGNANATAGGSGWVAVPGAAVTVTLPAGRRIRVDATAYLNGDAIGQMGGVAVLLNGAAIPNFQGVWYCVAVGTAGRATCTCTAIATSVAGANAFALAVNRQGAIGTNVTAIAPHAGTGLVVTDMGPASGVAPS
jgi:hypothetical protein